ncbi:MAG TPA: LuxR C-terminal-related transcriptional regulator [Polyangiaceae bacterium]|nr:LuxR C-terminal-related transcriptional regulator [Polyangiaceae bacterium]
MSILTAIDAKLDIRDGLDLPHVLVEETIVGLGVVGVLTMWWRLLRSIRRERSLKSHAAELSERLVETEQVLRAEADDLAARLAQTEQEAQRWKREAGGLLAGLGAAIDAQFDRWQFSPAERDIGLLLLKGLSHKEIARVRSVGEATVRQQAQRLYRKANIGSRNDLAAFFLEDLLLPSVERTSNRDERGPAIASSPADVEGATAAGAIVASEQTPRQAN